MRQLRRVQVAMLVVLTVTTILSVAANATALIYFARKVTQFMSSPEFEALSKDVAEAKAELTAKNAKIAELETANASLSANGTELHASLVASEAKVADLTAQLAAAQAAAGTPDADLAELDSELKGALDPVAPPAPDPGMPVAT